MKILYFFAIIILLSETTLGYNRYCKQQILRSLGFHSRITPNSMNSVCPRIAFNCCTIHDQMKIHKNWHLRTKDFLDDHYTKIEGQFMKLNQIVNQKDQFELGKMTIDLKKHSNVPIAKKIYNHLITLATTFNKQDTSHYQGVMKSLTTSLLPQMHEKLTQLRQGFLCMNCDWHNHHYINLESQTVTYKYSFCQNLISHFFKPIEYKYDQIMRMVMMLDEWLFLAVGRRLVSSATNRAIFRRYIAIVDECKDYKDVEHCLEFCREFNLNRLSLMFDGEEDVIDSILDNYEDFLKTFDKNPEQLYQERKSSMGYQQFTDYLENNSVFSGKLIKDPSNPEQVSNSLELNFRTDSKFDYFQKYHKTNDIQIKLLDSEVETLKLFETNDKPVDIANFLIIFSPFNGIDLFEDSSRTNLDLAADKILALIHQKDHNEHNLAEHITDRVISIIRPIQIKELGEWFNDQKMKFRKFEFQETKVDIKLENLKPKQTLLAKLGDWVNSIWVGDHKIKQF